MRRLFPRSVKAHPEDAAIRIALREVAREALALENLLGEGLLWGDEKRRMYLSAVARARTVGEMQWPAALNPPDKGDEA